MDTMIPIAQAAKTSPSIVRVPDTAPVSFTFTELEIRSLSSTLSLGLADALYRSGRLGDALSALLLTQVESVDRLGGRSGGGYGDNSSQELAQEFAQGSLLASRCGPDGLKRFLASIRDRGVIPLTVPETSFRGNHSNTNAHRAYCGELFDELAKTSPRDAMTLLTQAPSWACFHFTNETRHIERDLAQDSGFSLALSGLLSPELLNVYLERDGFCANLTLSERSTNRPSTWAGMVFKSFDPALDGAREAPLLTLLSRCIDYALAAPCAADMETGSILPESWMSSLVLGGFDKGRQMVFERLGQDACLAVAAKEGSLVHDSKAALAKGGLNAIENCIRCFGASKVLLAHTEKLSVSAVCMMAKSMDGAQFAKALDLFIAAGAQQALFQSCAHRFWAVYEKHSSVRKLGDALAYCAAEGLIDHAEALLRRLPSLERKNVDEILAYMDKRDAGKKLTSHAAWETLLFREATQESVPSAPRSTRARL